MRPLLALALLLASPLPAAESWEPAYAALLKKYVTPVGVDYAAWKAAPADVAALNALVANVARSGPTDPSRAGRLAFFINAYNVAMLGQVLAAYPIGSVKDIAPDFGVFTQKRVTVAGETLSLNDLERRRLLDAFVEPRIHFAINCASRSCPPLQAEPFTAARLEAQLEAATKAYLTANPLGLTLDGKTARASEIFTWYAKDFAAAGGAPAFIRRYRDVPPEIPFASQPYDWSLNARR